MYDGLHHVYMKEKISGVTEERTVATVAIDTDIGAQARIFTVSIRYKSVVQMAPLLSALSMDGATQRVPLKEILRALDAIMRQSPSTRFAPIGRSFFRAPCVTGTPSYLGGGREIWFGHHQSLQLAPQRLLLNVDVSATTFYRSMPVLDLLREVCCAEFEKRSPSL